MPAKTFRISDRDRTAHEKNRAVKTSPLLRLRLLLQEEIAERSERRDVHKTVRTAEKLVNKLAKEALRSYRSGGTATAEGSFQPTAHPLFISEQVRHAVDERASRLGVLAWTTCGYRIGYSCDEWLVTIKVQLIHDL